MKKIFVLLTGCLLLTAAAAFCEMGAPPDERPRREGMMEHRQDMPGQRQEMSENEHGGADLGEYMLPGKELNLTEEQKKSMENIGLENRKFRVKKEADINLARIDLAEIFRSDKPDFEAARTKVKEISGMQLEMKLRMIDTREKMFNLLTKEQQDKLPKIKAARREKHMEGMRKENTDKK